jgi:hypothetical protein
VPSFIKAMTDSLVEVEIAHEHFRKALIPALLLEEQVALYYFGPKRLDEVHLYGLTRSPSS